MLFGPRSWTWEAGIRDFLSWYVFGAQTDITNCYSIIDMLLVQKISIYFFPEQVLLVKEMSSRTTWWSAQVLFLTSKKPVKIFLVVIWLFYCIKSSSFVSTHSAQEWTIYPWIHSNCNSLSDNDQLRPVAFPDIHPARYYFSAFFFFFILYS